MTPRTILMRCDEHRKRCLAEGKIVTCDTLGEGPITDDVLASADGDSFDDELSVAAAAADFDGLLDDKDDGKLGMLLRDAFDLYAKQIPPHEDYEVVPKIDPGQKTPPLHGRLHLESHQSASAEFAIDCTRFCFFSRIRDRSRAVAPWTTPVKSRSGREEVGLRTQAREHPVALTMPGAPILWACAERPSRLYGDSE
jgi:hypothetical protein